MKKWLKKAYHKLVFDEHGAVSIYAIMITLLLFLFNAVLIDYMRIMVAERETEQAARAAARSVMANFDQGVKSYGLFGADGGQEEANEIFQKVFENHLAVDGSSGDIFHFSTPQPVSGEVNVVVDEGRMLAHSEIFKHQVLEEMKYSAPIEVGQALIEGILGISSAMEEASKLSKVHKKIRKDLEEREEKLDEALEKLRAAKDIIEGHAGQVQDSSSSSFPDVNNLDDVRNHFERYKEIRAEESESDEDLSDEEKEEREKNSEDADKFIERASNLAEGIYNDVREIGELLVDARTLIEEARVHNQNIADELASVDEDVDFSDAIDAGNMSNSDNSSGYSGAEGGIGEARDELDKLVFEDEFFETLLEYIRIGKDAVDDGAAQHTDAMRSKINAIGTMIDQEQPQFFGTTLGQLREAHELGSQNILLAFNHLKDGIEEMKSTDEKSSEEVEDKEDEADENLEDANEDLDDFLNGIADSNEGYDDLLEILSKYIEAADSEIPIDRGNTDDLSDSTFNLIDMLFKNMGNILLNARDELYVNEYIMTKFKSHDFSKQDYSVDQNEIEFILYGQANAADNFALAMTEIFAFRFAVNLVEAFTKQEVRVFGKFMWVAAIAYAIKETVIDIDRLRRGQRIEFFEGIRFEMDYRDHLRLFLFLHLEGNKIPRTMARIEQQSGSDLTQLPTYIEGNASSSLQLWFLPGVTSLLSNAGILSGEVKDREFIIEKEIYYSY
ncbi:hypothetical protein AJ85_17580 [Alkalihalobacillus alcalophilus ATCC 27647 = CGMCC 1.3604]|uniref:Uncharacterized protein n=1 Tax=Alkalihalobacillus alcalophilus ATCC 27647 = CGMCC 1.3604 TaxID=1218173 RepID=A0A094WJE7_ALKAL|nr:DUF5702 domain-containing protein [Alkalihalobacillus alcalophilus]KGA96961.1 hypothetical protein BALCAV_0213130 [Alkalihalobacillus alcalophilus ATCC 27647 = CGMCC 1.3604]MED1561340.1 DUF5702 domain-containing protein [Alkalihalobacillus alcalophilus]THG89480.1 hypothetical protein AJ85_17580 [Alkalihalobacillus alcalophilus ATCC 27647 = CGMCC 1.3604]